MPGLPHFGAVVGVLIWLICPGCSRGAEKETAENDKRPVAQPAPRQTQVLAFPGVEGAGRFATGGRGGEVVHVTNLDVKGPGSLADAVSKPNRIVVFDVSGVIDLTETRKERKGGKLEIIQPNITIAGQTAPGDGICIIGGSFDISASNVIVRHIRSRRGWIAEGDAGDSMEIKPHSLGALDGPAGITQEAFDKKVAKKAERGKVIHEFGELADIVIDHCSTSWATDENLSATHADRTTVGWCIAAEGCDYANPKQTPPNHSEGSLWGSQAPNGRATLHHTLYAHNRLRNPRTTGGTDVPPVLNFYNNVVYDWHEYASHTGSERVHLNWLNNVYKPGPSTPSDRRRAMFEFFGDPGARVFVRGNYLYEWSEATAENRLAVAHRPGKTFRDLSDAQRAAMIVGEPFADLPTTAQSALEAEAAVYADAGATLPARDPIDLRIIEAAKNGTGRIIEKETDLPEGERRLDYRSLDPVPDADNDGMPDFWERQFELDPNDAGDAMRIAAGGYANIEHYINSTDPSGSGRPVLFVSASVSRASALRPAEFRFARTGDAAQPLIVEYELAKAGTQSAIKGTTILLAGERVARIKIDGEGRGVGDTFILRLVPRAEYAIGCPSQALVVVEK